MFSGSSRTWRIASAAISGDMSLFAGGRWSAGVASQNEVSIPPGQIAMTRIPYLRASMARARLNPITPHFEAQ